MQDEELTSTAAAEYLKVSRTRVHELRQSGRIGRQVAGKYWIYTKSELDAYRAQAAANKGGRPKAHAGTLAQ